MLKTKSTVKKDKAVTAKKVTSNKPAAKPIKLGGVPNQGGSQASE